MSILTFRYRIKDGKANSSTRKVIWKLAAGVNFVWNYCNDLTERVWKAKRKILSSYDLSNLVAGCSKELGVHSQTLQSVCEEHAIKRAQFKRPKLKWRSRKRSLAWIPFKPSGFRMDDDSFTYCGHTFYVWLSRPLPGGVIKGGTITMDSRGRAYVNIQVELVDPPTVVMDGLGTGFDPGVKDQLSPSSGKKLNRENLTRHYEKKLATIQRAGKKKQTRNLHAKIKNTRRDWTHKQTTTIVKRSCFIAIGDVSSSKLAKTKMAKSVYDSNWGCTRGFLRYKAIRLGKIYQDTKEYGSTVTCCVCLKKTGPSGLGGLGVRKWTCVECKSIHDRDTNAAKNILSIGLTAAAQIQPSPLGHKRPSRHRKRTPKVNLNVEQVDTNGVEKGILVL